MPKRRGLVAVLGAAALVAALAAAAGAAAGFPEPEAPFTGVIQNHTQHPVSIDSANSSATLLVPPGGWIEYVAWKPEFQLTGFVDGQPVYCQVVKVRPGTTAFRCRYYDFMAEIKPPPGNHKKRPKKGTELQVIGQLGVP